jgi:GTP-binding protein
MKIRSVEFVGTVVDPKAPLPGDLPQVAFSGRSNVGKSSLINTLLGRTKSKVARVSATPGKTQALNFYRVNDAFLLVDLPGFGFARAPARVRRAWRPLVEGYLARSDGPRAVVHLVDVRREPTDDDLQMLDYLSGLGIPTLVGITKVDKLTRERRGKVVPALTKALALDPGQVVPVSSKTGEGKDDLLGAIERIVEGSGSSRDLDGSRDLEGSRGRGSSRERDGRG